MLFNNMASSQGQTLFVCRDDVLFLVGLCLQLLLFTNIRVLGNMSYGVVEKQMKNSHFQSNNAHNHGLHQDRTLNDTNRCLRMVKKETLYPRGRSEIV